MMGQSILSVGLLVLLFHVNLILGNNCPPTAATLQIVDKCPKTEQSWKEAAARKRCRMLGETQYCSNFHYHCLVNQWQNATLEVCAPTWFISGFCTIFNTDENKVIDNFLLDCTNFTDPCPTRYISTDAYKYQTCYDLVNKPKSQSANSSEEKEHVTPTLHSRHTPWVISTVVLLVVVIVLVVVLVVVLARMKAKRSSHRNICTSDPEGGGVEIVLESSDANVDMHSNINDMENSPLLNQQSRQNGEENGKEDTSTSTPEGGRQQPVRDIIGKFEKDGKPNASTSCIQLGKKENHTENQNDSYNITSMHPVENVDDDTNSDNINTRVTTNPNTGNSSNPLRDGECCTDTDRNTSTGTVNSDVQQNQTGISEDENNGPLIESTHDNDNIQKDESGTSDDANSTIIPSRESPTEIQRGDEVQNTCHNEDQESVKQGVINKAPNRYTEPTEMTPNPNLRNSPNPITSGETYTDQKASNSDTGIDKNDVQQNDTGTSDVANVGSGESTSAPLSTNIETTRRGVKDLVMKIEEKK